MNLSGFRRFNREFGIFQRTIEKIADTALQIRFVGPPFKRNSGPRVTRGILHLQSNRELLNDVVCDLHIGNSSSLETLEFDLEVVAAR